MKDYHQRIGLFFVGNYYVSDDGFALHLHDLMLCSPLPAHVDLVRVDCVGLAQMDLIHPYRKLIIVDALRGVGQPGEICRFDLLQVEISLAKAQLSAHDFGIIELLRLIASLYPENMPRHVILYGVEAEILNEFGTTLSDQVAKALGPMKNYLLAELTGEERLTMRLADKSLISC